MGIATSEDVGFLPSFLYISSTFFWVWPDWEASGDYILLEAIFFYAGTIQEELDATTGRHTQHRHHRTR